MVLTYLSATGKHWKQMHRFIALTSLPTSFGAAFTTFYRLIGPYRSSLAPKIAKTELWETITRRGILGNLMMGFIPMLGYGILNVTVFLVECLWTLCGRLVLARWLTF